MRLLSSSIVVCWLLASLVGCAETSTCPEGTARRINADGHAEGDCLPVAIDAGQDAQVELDSGPPDAGPCGVCPGTQVCDVDTMECVACVGPGDCSGDTPVCDTDAHTCVGCVLDSDCGDPTAARCNAGTCATCDDSAQCAGITGTEVCGASGECVQCTTLEAGACGGNPCTRDGTCSAFATDDRELCESCDTDANCSAASGHFCVPMQYMGVDRPGGYCLKSSTAPLGCLSPYRGGVQSRTSLSGVAGTFCTINENLATCEAVRALIDAVPCPGGTDAECPQPSGLCGTVGGSLNECTYPCGSPIHCLDPGTRSESATCGGSPMHCGGL